MRGRKHPLEIFRQNGQSFLTRDGDAQPPPPAPRAEVVGAPAIAIQPKRLVKPRDGKPRPTLARSAEESGRSKASRSRGGRVVALTSLGLVLLLGATYAVGLWPFAKRGDAGAGGLPLSRERSFLTDWLQKDRSDRPNEGDPTGTDGGRQAPAEGAEPTAAVAPAAKEYWVVVASRKLTDAEKKKAADKTKAAELKALFASDETRLKKGLGAKLDGFEIQPVFTNGKKEEMVLRIGRGTTQDDPRLTELRDQVKKLGGGFKDATIRGYVPATK